MPRFFPLEDMPPSIFFSFKDIPYSRFFLSEITSPISRVFI
jgi:hypothetical protein